jgi:uncharacterized protein YecE (DUF72 family)
MRLLAGASGYSFKEWCGTFYPEKMKSEEMLPFYSARLPTVEINNTFYRMPKPEMLLKWAGDVPETFVFILKASQRITHIQRLNDADGSLSYFLKVVVALQERLGPVLFQLPPNMKKDASRLRAFLDLLPKQHRAAFEFRHQSWFDSEVFGLLRDHQAALCIAEAENDLEIPFESTADWGYLRLRRTDYGDPELKAWAERVRQANWKDAFIFFKHEDEGKAPLLGKRFLELAG